VQAEISDDLHPWHPTVQGTHLFALVKIKPSLHLEQVATAEEHEAQP
jgi:hypothetical protein